LRAGFNSQLSRGPNAHISPSSSANFNNSDYPYSDSQAWSTFYSSPYLRNSCQITNSYPISYPITSHYLSAYPSNSNATSLNNLQDEICSKLYLTHPYSSTSTDTNVSNSTTNGVISTASCGVPVSLPVSVSVPNSLTPTRLYDYERRPPKSTELFDPKAPSYSDLHYRKQQSYPSINTLDTRNLNVRRTPSLSPTSISITTDKHLSKEIIQKINNTSHPINNSNPNYSFIRNSNPWNQKILNVPSTTITTISSTTLPHNIVSSSSPSIFSSRSTSPSSSTSSPHFPLHSTPKTLSIATPSSFIINNSPSTPTKNS